MAYKQYRKFTSNLDINKVLLTNKILSNYEVLSQPSYWMMPMYKPQLLKMEKNKP